MTLPATVRVNVGAPFPALTKGGGPVSVAKAGGIWTVGLNFAGLARPAVIADPANSYALIWNSVTGAFSLAPVSAIFASKVTKILTGVGALASPYAAQPNDEVLIVKQGAAVAFTVTVDWSQRTKPLRVVAGDTPANFANITITPAAGQTQMAVANYSYIIDSSGGSITLTPLPDQTGAY